MDGPLRPNSYLDECPAIDGEVFEPDDIAADENDTLYVSSGNRILSLSGNGYLERRNVAEFDNSVTGLTALSDGGLAACVAGQGVCFVGGKRDGDIVGAADGEPINCPLSIIGSINEILYVTDGSRRHMPDRWAHDLMEKGASGRLIRIDPGKESGTTMIDGLSWPYGVELSQDGRSLVLTESWRHSLSRVQLVVTDELKNEVVLDNLPGYPARVVSARDGGYWLCLFALRNHLIEFVLEENAYRSKMMQTVDPAFWIAPALKSTDHILEPVQQAGIKHWGEKKDWAPPRSYGLILRLDPKFRPVNSFHSRINGTRHGITGLAVNNNGVLVASKGGDQLLMIGNEGVA